MITGQAERVGLILRSNVLIVGCLIGFAGTGIALGNAGPRDTSVKIAGEPTGIREVGILHESLTLDFRPFASGQAAHVEAVYSLRNEGPVQELQLLFAFGSPTQSGCQVTLDGKPITGEVRRGAEMPSQWWPPKTTPSLPGDDSTMIYAGAWASFDPLAFDVIVPSGESELRVRYDEHGKTTYARPAMYRQFAYILAPARSWDGFGGLDVTMYVPDGWAVACSPKLERDGPMFRRSFDEVPADAIGITLRPPVPRTYQVVSRMSFPLILGTAVIGLAACWWWGGSRVRRDAGRPSQESPIGKTLGVFPRAICR